MPRKKKASRDKGRPIRISNLVLEALDKKKKVCESYDAILRRFIGLPDRRGAAQPRSIYCLLPKSLIARKSRAEAKGESVLQAVRQGKKKVIEAPIKVTESL